MKKETILVVDDSAIIRKIIERELTDAGYEVLTAINGIEALSMLAWMEEKPDLITLDIDMPRMNGFEVCHKLKEDYDKQLETTKSHDPIPVIFVSANDSLENRRIGFQLEVLDFISKPFKPGTVAKTINTILNPDQQFTGQQVLVVDDSSSIRRMIKKTLKRLGVQVTEAANGLEAITIIEKESNDFDLIVTDYMMPEMRGDEFCRLLRQHPQRQQVPVIIISAFDDQDLILAFFKAGATDYLSKPFIEEELHARLQIHLQARVYSRQLERLNNKLRYLAERDGLTGVYNRRFFQETLHKHFNAAKQFQQDLCCILLDLDHFKKVNDQCGHAFGDIVLIQFATLLKIKVQRSDIVARYGGEEFVILLPKKNIQHAIDVAETIRQAAEEYVYVQEKIQRQVTVSVGVSSFKAHTPDQPDHLVTMADDALYLAKENGRNQVYPYVKPQAEQQAGKKTG